MLFARFVPYVWNFSYCWFFASKKKVAVSSGSLATHNALFIGLLIFVVILVGA